MAEKKMVTTVEHYLRLHPEWNAELSELRAVVKGCQLQETIKWRVPCYTWQDKNVCLISALKDCCALSFPKGTLLDDASGLLDVPGPNSHAARLIRFTQVSSIRKSRRQIEQWIRQAIDLEKVGAKVEPDNKPALVHPPELEKIFQQEPDLRRAFETLTPGRQRGYLLHFNAAKQSATRTRRIRDCRVRILSGKGLRDCTCGLSQRMPNCDGSHKQADQR